MEKDTFAPWELEYAHAAQPVKEETVSEKRKRSAETLLTRAGWHKQWRTVVVKDSDARDVSQYWNTGKTKFLFSENQTTATRQTRRQWEEHGRRVIVNNSEAEIVPSRHDSTHIVHVFTIEQTEPI
jgi:hypothetical protein